MKKKKLKRKFTNSKRIFKVKISLFFAALFLFTSCSPKIKPYTASEAIETLKSQSSELKTMRGRAWVSVTSKNGSASFPAVLVLDLSKKSDPKMRVDAIDPLGATHGVSILTDHCLGDKGSRRAAPICLTWADFDQKTLKRHVRNWNGFPLEELPYLMLGISESSTLAAGSESGLVDIRSFFRQSLDLTWIEPGPRLAINAVQGKLNTGEEFFVHYSQYLEKPDFYLPKQVDLKAPAFGFEVSIKWRERAWNESVDPKAFELSDRVLETFRAN